MKKFLSIILSILMVVTMLPMAVMPVGATGAQVQVNDNFKAEITRLVYTDSSGTTYDYTDTFNSWALYDLALTNISDGKCQLQYTAALLGSDGETGWDDDSVTLEDVSCDSAYTMSFEKFKTGSTGKWEYTIQISKTAGHSFSDWADAGDGTHTRICSACSETETQNHSFDGGNCLTVGKCDCGLSSIDSNVHAKPVKYVVNSENNFKHDEVYECCGVIKSNLDHKYDSKGMCKECKYQCAHSSFTDSICDNCGYECPHENITDGKCDACGLEGTVVTITMTDSYSDGWSGNWIVIKQLADGEYTETVTLENGSSETFTALLRQDGIYAFSWVKGDYPEECSFTVTVDGETVYECADGSTLTDGQMIYVICEHTSYTDGKCDVCGYECPHKNITDGKCDNCGTEGTFVTIDMTDSYGDGWNGNAVVIKQFVDGVYTDTEAGTATIEYGAGGTFTTVLPKDGIYAFSWVYGEYPEECSFTLTVDGETVYECADVGTLADSEIFYIICKHTSYTDGKCDVCDYECPHENQTGSVCEICGEHICSYNNGFCTECDAYQPATLVTNENYESFYLKADYVGYYAISNAGQLFWYANYINTVDRTANAVLTADIDLENRPWTPIGSTGENSNNFRGIFDGQNYYIRGLYVEGDRAGLGFFGEVRTGTVKNFTIFGEVVVNTEVDYVGGVIGSICGVNGETDLERNGAIIQNIRSFVNLTVKAHGVGKIGGFVGYANHESLIEKCSWYGTFDAGEYRVDSGAGGFIGKIQENSSEVTIRNCAAYGTIKTNYAGDYNNTATIYMGGFLSFSNTNAKTVLENCLFAGRFERGENLTDEAFLGAFGTLRSVKAIKNCYYLGDDGLEAVHSDSNLKPGSDNVEITKVTGEDLRGEMLVVWPMLGEYWEQGVHYPTLKDHGTHWGSETYSYTDNGDGTHDMVCTGCGYVVVYNEAHTPADNATYTDNNDGTHSSTCALCGNITEEHAFDENGTCVCGVNLFSVSGSTLTIDGTLGGKTEATEGDITVLVNKIQDCVDNGITTIIVTGSEPALYNFYGIDTSAVSAALYYLADGRSDSPYCGTIDLILPDVTEIVDDEFNNTFALNSITLPKVTTVGDGAFYGTTFLQTLTFGSVITFVNEKNWGPFHMDGYEVGGCDLVLNCGQLQAEDKYKPNFETNVWFIGDWSGEYEWKSITLTHTEGTAATCTELAVCSVCGESYGELDADAHNWANLDGICANGCETECAHENETGDTCSVCGATIKFATITGVSINVDGVVYTSDNTSAENPAVIHPDSVVTVTVTGENFDLLPAGPENAMIGFTYFSQNMQWLYNDPSEFDIDTVNNTVSFLANYNVLSKATTASELTYTNDGWYTDIGSGVYVIYIDKKDIADTLITLDNTEFIYSGNPIEPTVLVMADGQALMEGEHYTLTFESNVNAGTASVTVKGIGDYTGEVTKDFTITKAYYNLTAPTPNTLTYNGEEQYLVSAGTVEGADFEYSLDGASWSTSIPQAKDVGNYTVYYRVLADENHYGIEGTVDVTIKECPHTWDEDGYCRKCKTFCKHENNVNGVCTVCDYVLTFSVITGDTVSYYDSFDDALENAEEGSTVKLMKGLNQIASYEINKSITLDLNGNSWDTGSSDYIDVYTFVTFTDSVGTGELNLSLNLYAPCLFNSGTYKGIGIMFETEDTLDDYLAECHGFFDHYTGEFKDVSDEKYVMGAKVDFYHKLGVQTCKGYQCEICGEYFGEADPDAHDWSNKDGICAICAYECAHEWDEGVLTRPVYDAVLGSKDGYCTYTCTVCGEKKTEAVKSADYSAYEAVSEEINALLQSDDLTSEAKQAIYSAANECELLSNDLTESEQNKVDSLVAELEKIVADAEEKIASGEYVKADYTEIDEAIKAIDEALENATISEEMANEFSDIKSQLEALKVNENTSMADVAELLERVKAVAETMADCANGIHSFTKYEEVTAPECGKAGLEKAVCDYGCGATDEKEIPALEHIDEDGDYLCDHGCGHEFEKPVEPEQPDTPDIPDEPTDEACDHLCHSNNAFVKFIWKIINFFFRLFNIQQYCDCGELHYKNSVFG